MDMPDFPDAPSVTFDFMTRPKFGFAEPGDVVVGGWDNDRFVICMADGTGHGRPAAEAARRVRQAVAEPAGRSIGHLFEDLETSLQATLGAAVSIVIIDPRKGWIECAGVGNVQILISGEATSSCPLRPGIVGRRARPPYITKRAVTRSEVILLATDGVRVSSLRRFGEIPRGSITGAARRIVEGFGKKHDDVGCALAKIGG